MQIIDFSTAHIEQAAQIALQNYMDERLHVPSLPQVDAVPDLAEFAENKRGVAAIDGGKLLGFHCWSEPRNGFFGQCKGTWTPMHAHGAAKENSADIYDRLYQIAAERLVAEEVFSHSVTLYEHDTEAVNMFFQNGFGGRFVDAIRDTSPIDAPICDGLSFRQARSDDTEDIARMNNRLIAHLRGTPMFLPFFKEFTDADIENGMKSGDYQYFLAFDRNRPVAYIRLQPEGENFACDDPEMMNISGAYALPEVQGKGVTARLLSWLLDWLRERGYSRCGVDFECFNYTARKFWLKYFTAYTTGVVRRIDERIHRMKNNE